MNLAGDEFAVVQMVLYCWKNISPAYISCTNTGKIRTSSWQKGAMQPLHFGSLYILTKRIKISISSWAAVAMGALALHPTVRGRPKLRSPASLSAPSTNSKTQTESQKQRWNRVGFVYNRGSPQRTIVVPKLFLVGWEGLGTLGKRGEQNYQNQHLFWIVLKRKELKEASGFFICSKCVLKRKK